MFVAVTTMNDPTETAITVPQDRPELASAAPAGEQPGKESDGPARRVQPLGPRLADANAGRFKQCCDLTLACPGGLPQLIRHDAKFRHLGSNPLHFRIGRGHAIARRGFFHKALAVPNKPASIQLIIDLTIDNARATADMASDTGIPPSSPRRSPVQMFHNSAGIIRLPSCSAKVPSPWQGTAR
jgi:hypothetical protein